jgi:hypothetical protein
MYMDGWREWVDRLHGMCAALPFSQNEFLAAVLHIEIRMYMHAVSRVAFMYNCHSYLKVVLQPAFARKLTRKIRVGACSTEIVKEYVPL